MQDAALLLFLVVKGKRKKKAKVLSLENPLGKSGQGITFSTAKTMQRTHEFCSFSTFPSSLFFFRLPFQYHLAWKG